MTLPALPVKVNCANCSGDVWVTSLLSTNRFGSADLDLRPPPDERFNMDFWVQRCPHCGYCAASVAEATLIAPEFVQSAIYQQQLRETATPDLANSFLCQSLIQEALGKLDLAARATLRAAWACDDAALEVEATGCRRRAAQLFDDASAKGQTIHRGAHLDVLVRIDLARRCRDFPQAARLIDDALAGVDDPELRTVLQFQARLATLRDSGCYSMDAASDQ